MALFGNLFKKQNCTLCGKECGTLGRTKLRDDTYVCSDCIKECSRHVRVSEFTKDEVTGHIEYMKHQERIYKECFSFSPRTTHPSSGREQAITFCDDVGMFEIVDRKNADHKAYHELFRYDQVAGYEPYVKYGTAKDGAKEKPFEEYGVKITLLRDRDLGVSPSDDMRGRRSHPYVKHPITICFSKDEKEYNRHDDSVNVIQHFQYIFGAKDDQRALFSFKGSKNEQRQMKAAVEMGKMFAATMKAAKAGEDSAEVEAAKQQFAQTKDAADAHLTHGLSKYTKAADEAEERCLN